jgi:hypothetical protein
MWRVLAAVALAVHASAAANATLAPSAAPTALATTSAPVLVVHNTTMAPSPTPADELIVVVEQVSVDSYFPPLSVAIGYAVIVLASDRISDLFPRLGLPRMTGYILAGIVSGPFVLNLIPATHIRKLRVIDEASLGFIALAAGSKFNYFEMRPVLTSIVAISGALVLIEYLTGFAVFAVLVPLLGYYGGAGFETIAQLTWRHVVAMAMLAGSLTVARSPSSVMAIVDELKATGAFTRLAIGVTIFLDLGAPVLRALSLRPSCARSLVLFRCSLVLSLTLVLRSRSVAAVIWLYDVSESAAHTLTVTAVSNGADGGGQQPFAIVTIALARLAGSTVASAALGIALGIALPHVLLFNVQEERLSGCFRRIENVRSSTALGRALRALRATVWAARRKDALRRRWVWIVERAPQVSVLYVPLYFTRFMLTI